MFQGSSRGDLTNDILFSSSILYEDQHFYSYRNSTVQFVINTPQLALAASQQLHGQFGARETRETIQLAR